MADPVAGGDVRGLAPGEGKVRHVPAVDLDPLWGPVVPEV